MQINQNRAFIATENFRQSPIKLTVAKPSIVAYIVGMVRKLTGFGF